MNRDSPTDLTVGGVSKDDLRRRLAVASVSLNAYAEVLFGAPEFTVSEEPQRLHLVSLSLSDLDLPTGGPLPAILERGESLGYALCALEVAPLLRLQLLDQPPGPCLTIASPRLRPHDMHFPAGFYLRRLDDGAWLRGYRTDDDWIWPPDFSRFVFSLPG